MIDQSHTYLLTTVYLMSACGAPQTKYLVNQLRPSKMWFRSISRWTEQQAQSAKTTLTAVVYELQSFLFSFLAVAETDVYRVRRFIPSIEWERLAGRTITRAQVNWMNTLAKKKGKWIIWVTRGVHTPVFQHIFKTVGLLFVNELVQPYNAIQIFQ